MTNNRHRWVALRLHKLVALDRKWILDRLPESDRATIAAYLGELKGFRIDDETMESVDGEFPAMPIASNAGAAYRNQPHLIEHVLSHEPGWLRHALRLDGEPYGDAPVLTSKARQALEDVFQKQVQMLEEKRMPKLPHARVSAGGKTIARQSSFLTRLSESWRR